ncbi:MAG: hypothetical protein HRT92_08030 [Piscirickettsiaceae bacterium]|nr:hypothetical protein [Piscirickettsiaceae bacterium]
MSTSKQLPHLKVVLNSPNHQNYRHIVHDGKKLHYIQNVREFYYTLGYTDNMARANILPDEFVWDEYTNNSGYSVCLQKHILDYLNKYSPTFYEDYGDAYNAFEKEHNDFRIARGDSCAGCRLHEFCEDSK